MDIVLQQASTYEAQNYANDVGDLIKAMEAATGIPNKNMLICPSVATGPWTPGYRIHRHL
jgi:hypothetical protein